MPLRQILRSANAFDERAARDARVYLENLQAELTRRLVENVGDKWELQHYETARREVYSLLAEIERKLTDDLKGVIEGAGEIGKELADDLLKDLRVDVFGLPKLTLGFVREAANASATLVKGITDGIRQKIDLEIDRGIQGLQTGIQTIKNIASIRGFTAGAFKTATDRAEFIFRTEASRIINMATIERYKEFSERSDEEMLKYWLATNDSRTRDTHEQIWRETDPRVGGTPIAFKKDFKLSDGDKGFGPSAPTFSVENVINCLLPDTMILGKYNIAMRGSYTGKAIKIITASGRHLSVTPNHPILTDKGIVNAGLLQKGQKMLSYVPKVNFIATAKNKYYKPILIQKVFQSFSLFGLFKNGRAAANDFNGDGTFFDGNIDIVCSNRLLLNYINTIILQNFCDIIFKCKNAIKLFLMRLSSFAQFCIRSFFVTHRIPGCRTLTLNQTPILFKSLPFDNLSSRSSSDSNINAFKFVNYSRSGNTNFSRNFLQRFATQILSNNLFYVDIKPNTFRRRSWLDSFLAESFMNDVNGITIDSRNSINGLTGFINFDEIVDVVNFDFSGHVYDLQSCDNTIIANNFLICNCRCRLIVLTKKKYLEMKNA